MAKYTREELRQKAVAFLAIWDKPVQKPNADGENSAMVMMMLSLATGLNPDVCLQKIRELAKDEK